MLFYYKRAYPQAYLEQCKFKLKKRKIVNFIDDESIDENDYLDDGVPKEEKQKIFNDIKLEKTNYNNGNSLN